MLWVYNQDVGEHTRNLIEGYEGDVVPVTSVKYPLDMYVKTVLNTDGEYDIFTVIVDHDRELGYASRWHTCQRECDAEVSAAERASNLEKNIGFYSQTASLERAEILWKDELKHGSPKKQETRPIRKAISNLERGKKLLNLIDSMKEK